MFCGAAPSSPTWSAYDGIDEDTEFADIIFEGRASGVADPLAKTLRRAAKKIRMISRGAQGVVYCAKLLPTAQSGTLDDDSSATIVAQHPRDGGVVAIKRLFSNSGGCYVSQSTVVCAEREVGFLQRFAQEPQNFPHMIRLFDVLHAPARERCVVLEHCPFSLASVAIRNGKRARDPSMAQWPEKLDARCIAYILREALLALQELHNGGIAHRDVKLSNIMVREDGALRFVDFGSAREVHGESVSSSAGNATPAAVRTTLLYRSPEGLIGPIPLAHLFAQDSWGVGVVFAELLRGKHLFQAHGELAMINQVFDLIGAPTEATWPSFFQSPVAQSFTFTPSPNIVKEKFDRLVSAEGVDLLAKLLCGNPDERISVTDALCHPYFNDLVSHLDEVAEMWKGVVAHACSVQHNSGGEHLWTAHNLMQQLMFGGDGDCSGEDDDEIDDRFS